MLTIRSNQLALLAEDRVKSASELLARRLSWMYPQTCVELGVVELQRLVSHGIACGRSHGIEDIDPLTRLLGLMLQFGRDFERSPVAASANALLRLPDMPGRLKVIQLGELLDRDTRGRVLVYVNSDSK